MSPLVYVVLHRGKRPLTFAALLLALGHHTAVHVLEISSFVQ